MNLLPSPQAVYSTTKVLPEFIAKGIELIADLKQAPSESPEKNCLFGLQSSTRYYDRAEINRNYTAGQRSLYLEVLQPLKSHPQLIERWKFEITPRRVPQHLAPSTLEARAKSCLCAVHSTSLSISHNESTKVAIKLKSVATELVPWDPSLPHSRLLGTVITLDIGEAICSVCVEYLKATTSPTVNRDLEQEGTPRSHGSSMSTEVENLRSFLNNQKLSAIDSDGFLEETEIGFKLISSELCSDQNYDSELEDDDGLYTIEMAIDMNPFEGQYSEDDAIAKYKLDCDRARKLGLFNGADSIFVQISSISREWDALTR